MSVIIANVKKHMCESIILAKVSRFIEKARCNVLIKVLLTQVIGNQAFFLVIQESKTHHQV